MTRAVASAKIMKHSKSALESQLNQQEHKRVYGCPRSTVIGDVLPTVYLVLDTKGTVNFTRIFRAIGSRCRRLTRMAFVHRSFGLVGSQEGLVSWVTNDLEHCNEFWASDRYANGAELRLHRSCLVLFEPWLHGTTLTRVCTAGIHHLRIRWWGFGVRCGVLKQLLPWLIGFTLQVPSRCCDARVDADDKIWGQ